MKLGSKINGKIYDAVLRAGAIGYPPEQKLLFVNLPDPRDETKYIQVPTPAPNAALMFTVAWASDEERRELTEAGYFTQETV